MIPSFEFCIWQLFTGAQRGSDASEGDTLSRDAFMSVSTEGLFLDSNPSQEQEHEIRLCWKAKSEPRFFGQTKPRFTCTRMTGREVHNPNHVTSSVKHGGHGYVRLPTEPWSHVY